MRLMKKRMADSEEYGSKRRGVTGGRGVGASTKQPSAQVSYHRLSYKTTQLVWRTVKNMEANGKELPAMEELEHQPSKHPPKCLVTNLGYANKLKNKGVAIAKATNVAK